MRGVAGTGESYEDRYKKLRAWQKANPEKMKAYYLRFKQGKTKPGANGKIIECRGHSPICLGKFHRSNTNWFICPACVAYNNEYYRGAVRFQLR